MDNQWVRQPKHCLKTTDLKKAIEYQKEIMSFQNWITRDNLPASCVDGPTQFAFPSSIPVPTEAPPIEFTVWAFHLIDGKWSKDDEILLGQQVDSQRPGRCACVHQEAQRHTRLVRNHQRPGLRRLATEEVGHHLPWSHSETRTAADSGQYAIGGGYVHTSDGRTVYDPEFSPGGRTIYGPHATWRIGRDANRNLRTDDDWADRQQQQSMDDFNRQMELNAMMNQQSQ